ncbi:hypothetical protein AB0C02_06315 [Micromonospora sp. NPDC048999]|uniref:hypothetical protein n=1 Tax=Micromonospora sp. NPDC048999 TaxID=3155391 RepID=UPI0033D3210D
MRLLRRFAAIATAAALVGLLTPAAAAQAGTGTPGKDAPYWVTDAGYTPYTVDPGHTLALYNQNGRVELFWIGTATTYTNPGALYHQWYNANDTWSAPQSLGGLIYDSFCGLRNPAGTLEIFVKAKGKDVNHIRQKTPAGDWTGFQNDIGGLIADGMGVHCYHLDSGSGVAVRVYGPDKMWHYKVRNIMGEWPTQWS